MPLLFEKYNFFSFRYGLAIAPENMMVIIILMSRISQKSLLQVMFLLLG